MCGEVKCRHPERLEQKTKRCTLEQIKECHGDVEKHPCEKEKKMKKKKKTREHNWRENPLRKQRI